MNFDWKTVDTWTQLPNKVLTISSYMNFSEFEATNAKSDELKKW